MEEHKDEGDDVAEKLKKALRALSMSESDDKSVQELREQEETCAKQTIDDLLSLEEPKKKRRALYVCGPVGTGKTVLLRGIAEEYQKKGISSGYVNCIADEEASSAQKLIKWSARSQARHIPAKHLSRKSP